MSTTVDSNAATRSSQGLSRWQAVPLAVGSVAGSGILVLPSSVYAEAGGNSLLVWLVATLLCLPMLLMFHDIVRAYPDGGAIEGCITAGLGHTLGRSVPVMFVGIVSMGLPAGAFVAGDYVAQAMGGGSVVQVLTAAAVLTAALVVNLAGARANTATQHAGTAALVVMSLVLICSAIPAFDAASPAITPNLGHLGGLLSGVVLAFWAFAGFENLTFLSRQFRAPERDFLPASSIALGVYGVLTVLLTMALVVRVPRARVDEVAGLLQLAGYIEPAQLIITVVTVIAVGAMVLNAVSWIWGVSRLVIGAAESNILPAGLASSTARGVPRRAIGMMTALFLLTGSALTIFPGILVDSLAAASSTFIVLYLLCIVSYTRLRGLTWRSAANLGVLVVLAATFVDSGWHSLYGLVALAMGAAVSFFTRHNRA